MFGKSFVRRIIAFAAVGAGVCCVTTCAIGQEAQPEGRRSVFDMPQLQAQLSRYNLLMLASARAGRMEQAEKVVREVIQSYPDLPQGYYNLACILAVQGKKDEAFIQLEAAVEKGFTNVDHMRKDPDLAPLREEKQFENLVRQARERTADREGKEVVPGGVKNGTGTVRESNTRWHSQLGVFFVSFEKPPASLKEALPIKDHAEVGDLIREWYEEGMASGNYGDFYDNHDGDHSNMAYGEFPQITRIEFGEEARRRNLHVGLQRQFVYNRPTIGNSSMAVTRGWQWRSQARLAMVRAQTMRTAAYHYRANHLYFYPEHRDYDDKRGDVFPANHPYHVISQGSSGSDRAFMDAAACILAAFRPDTKQALVKNGLLMPTVQMIFRMGLKGVESDEDYLSGKAHPVVYSSGSIDLKKMVELAHSIKPESLPPLVVLNLDDLNSTGEGVQKAGVTDGEVLFQTPQAIGLVYRRLTDRMTFRVNAGKSASVNGEDLRFEWRVLQGDADEIQIKTENNGKVAKITVPYFQTFPVRPGSKKMTSRVDIGCFATTGKNWSAPAFVSIYRSAKEQRKYDESGRILVADYMGNAKQYHDPFVFPRRNWRDQFHYTDDGKVMGWTRTVGEDIQEYTRHGLLVQSADDQGRPVLAQAVSYPVESDDGPQVMKIKPVDRHFQYIYTGEEDKLGQVVPVAGE